MSHKPEEWVIAALVDIETVADELTKSLSAGFRIGLDRVTEVTD